MDVQLSSLFIFPIQLIVDFPANIPRPEALELFLMRLFTVGIVTNTPYLNYWYLLPVLLPGNIEKTWQRVGKNPKQTE